MSLVDSIKDKLFKKEDGGQSPPVLQKDPQKPKRKLGDDDDGPVFKLDLLRILDDQAKANESATLQLLSKDKEHYKVLLAEHAQTTTNATNQALSSFVVATQKQFEIVDTRIDNVEREVETCKANNDELQKTVASMQAEQQRLASALVLADRHGSVTRQEADADEFDRPTNQEIIKIFSPKFVAPGEVENTLSPFMEECGFSPETWKLNSSSNGKDFHIQFLQNALASANHVKTVCSKLKSNGVWRVFMVNTVKQKPDGSFETVKIRVGKDQNAKDRVRSFMVKMFYEAWEKTHPQHVVKFFRGGFHIITTDKPTPKENETPIAKMDPKSGSIERTYITWNHPALAKFKIDKDKLLDYFMGAVSNPMDAVEWCV
jgi:hypothetical protein